MLLKDGEYRNSYSFGSQVSYLFVVGAIVFMQKEIWCAAIGGALALAVKI